MPWLFGLLHGDPGSLLMPTTCRSRDLIGGRLVNSLMLAGTHRAGLGAAGADLGITAAICAARVYDRTVNLLIVGVVSVPEFLFATSRC